MFVEHITNHVDLKLISPFKETYGSIEIIIKNGGFQLMGESSKLEQ